MDMDKAINDYFYNLAVVTIAFVGFAGLYIGFKQQQKAKMTKFDVLLTENHFLLSFMVVGAALLPPLLGLVPFKQLYLVPSKQLSWKIDFLQVASVIAAIPPLIWSVTYPWRRYAAVGTRMPTFTKVLLAFYFLTSALLLVNACVNLPISRPALYAVALTVQQFTNVITFMYALRRYVLNPVG